MGRPLVPLSLGLIDEGELIKDVDTKIVEAAQALVANYATYANEKAFAEVTVKVRIKHSADNSYTVTGKVDTKFPGRPARQSLAIHEIEQTGEDVLFVRAAGSSADSPRQMKLSTDDGRAIDPETGDPRPHPKKKA